MNRRHFLKAAMGTAAVAALRVPAHPAESSTPQIMTVRGLIDASDAGLVLPHEHVTTDFIGAERAPTPRYDRDSAFEIILPHLRKLKERGVSTLVECTPQYIGRDAVLLRRLSESSGLHILTNTGYYGAVGNKFLPRHAHDESADQLTKRWLDEWRDGIDGTGIRPGFIKLGVERGKLTPLHEKLVRAAASVHRQSGLTICVHTGDGAAARDELRILAEEGVAPEAFVWVHAQNDPGPIQIEIAKAGGWVSLDGYNLGARNPDRYLNRLAALKEAGCLGRVLVSHDDGWAVEGEEHSGAGLKLFGNGNPRPYESIFTRLAPDLRSAGFTNEEITTLTRVNPQIAFAIAKRLRG